jgi:hypothetical protein
MSSLDDIRDVLDASLKVLVFEGSLLNMSSLDASKPSLLSYDAPAPVGLIEEGWPAMPRELRGDDESSDKLLSLSV